MLKEIEALQEARKRVNSEWALAAWGSAVEAKLERIRDYLDLRLDILLMLTENAVRRG